MVERIESVIIARGGLRACVLSLGASLFDLSIELPTGPRRVILQLPSHEDYRDNPNYLGVIAGRCANRIRGGEVVIGGRRHQLDLNERNKTHLHGGAQGFSRMNWRIDGYDSGAVQLSLTSPDGDMGYPGTVTARCRYEVMEGLSLRITLEARTDADTLVNLAAHGYFNLLPGSSILDHLLEIAAESYTPVDADLIPDGRILAVAGTAFDFRTARAIGAGRGGSPQGYDHNFVLARERSAVPRHAAALTAPDRSLTMEILTTEPGLQFYDGQGLDAPAGDGRKEMVRFGGLCLEPQRFPDAVHHANFAQSLLRAGEEYRQVTEYRFSAGHAAA